MSTKGINVSNKALEGAYTEYDSRRARTQIALSRKPPHLDIFNLEQGRAQATSAGNNFYIEETLFSMQHGLKYKPEVLTYYYNLATQNYAIGKIFFAFGAVDDYLTPRITDTTFSIVHITDGFGSTAYTSTAPSTGPIRMKYMIISRPANKLTSELVL